MSDDLADLRRLRVLIAHDWLIAWGGAERTLEQMLEVLPQADVLVGLKDPRLPANHVTRRARETWMGRIPFAHSHHRWLLPLYPLAFRTARTAGYDLVISSAHAFAKVIDAPPGVPHLCYCYSPPRYLWDLRTAYGSVHGGQGMALRLAGPLLRWIDRRSARHVDRFVAISLYIADRIRRTYGREAAVVYPPVAARPASSARRVRTRTLLSLGRLVPYKRVDLAIQAATALGLPLLVAGDGPERARLESLAGPNVTFLGQVDESRAAELLETSALMVFCAEEDFGIAPVEANLHGLPVVAFRRGAASESMIDGVSAVYFDEQTPSAVAAAITLALATPWQDQQVRASGARFSNGRFRLEFAEQVRKALADFSAP